MRRLDRIRIKHIVAVVLFVFVFIVLANLIPQMSLIRRDLSQATDDTGLQLFLTGVLLAGLFFAGWWLRGWSLRRQLVADELTRYSNRREQITRLNYSASFWQGISTELFGAVITTLCFGCILLVFQQYQTLQSRKAELILQMGSPDNGFAREALRILSTEGWTYDGSLAGANLAEANLEGANLQYAHLEGVDLRQANLEGVNFTTVHI